jgi:hypothetical protein
VGSSRAKAPSPSSSIGGSRPSTPAVITITTSSSWATRKAERGEPGYAPTAVPSRPSRRCVPFRYRRLTYVMSTATLCSATMGYPRSDSHSGDRDPRPLASTTSAALSTDRDDLSPPDWTVTPVTVVTCPTPSVATRPRAVQPEMISTPGSAATRRRSSSSSSGRLADSPMIPDGRGQSSSPLLYQWMADCMSSRIAPRAVIPAVNPGSSASRTPTPAASTPCGCRACGTPRRTLGWSGSRSRSMIVTRSNESLRTHAASRPPTLAPITTARFAVMPTSWPPHRRPDRRATGGSLFESFICP